MVGTACDVLVVDDDDDIRASIRLVLEEEGYHVAEARDGLHALQFLRQHPACLVIVSDYMMPHMDGAALLREVVKEQGKDCHKFVFVSAKSHMFSPEFTTQVREMGVTVMRKPFDIDDLLANVERAAHDVPPLAESDDEPTPPSPLE